MWNQNLHRTHYSSSEKEFTGSDDAELTSLTIGQYFKNVVDNYGDNPAIIVKHQDGWTIGSIGAKRNVLRAAYANGVESGDRVAYGLEQYRMVDRADGYCANRGDWYA